MNLETSDGKETVPEEVCDAAKLVYGNANINTSKLEGNNPIVSAANN